MNENIEINAMETTVITGSDENNTPAIISDELPVMEITPGNETPDEGDENAKTFTLEEIVKQQSQLISQQTEQLQKMQELLNSQFQTSTQNPELSEGERWVMNPGSLTQRTLAQYGKGRNN